MIPPKVIAEIGCNHKGDIGIAKKMIGVAALFCEVDVVKFQKRCPRELLSREEYNSPHPNPMHAYGETYGQHREALEFNSDQHRELYEYCQLQNVEYSSSVWDLRSAKEITALGPAAIKIPSACNLRFNLLGYLCDNFEGEIHVSFGMTTQSEEDKIVEFFESNKRSGDLIIYSCTSGYPVSFEDICLLEIERLREKFENRVKGVGFSGHHLGIAADIAGMTLGARWIERHFTLDRTWKGTDHAASLEPDGMRKLARDVRNVYKAMRRKGREILDIEELQRIKLKRLYQAQSLSNPV